MNLHQDEINHLKQKLKEATEGVEKEQILKHRLSEDASKLIKENAILNRQIIDLQTMIEQVRVVHSWTK